MELIYFGLVEELGNPFTIFSNSSLEYLDEEARYVSLSVAEAHDLVNYYGWCLQR